MVPCARRKVLPHKLQHLLALLEHEDGSGTLGSLGVTKEPVEAAVAQLLQGFGA